jgi:DNA-binding NarL/FixJ family response regulator
MFFFILTPHGRQGILTKLAGDKVEDKAMSIRIVLCDDHQIIREGLRSLLEKQKDMAVVGEGTNGHDAIRLASESNPNVIVLDVSMPDLNGIGAAQRLHESHPNLKILALSMHSDKHFVTGMLEAGASGYMLKDCAFSELVNAIRTLMGGGLYISPRIAGNVLKEFALRVNPSRKMDRVDLSDREKEILQLIAEGHSTKKISSILHISVKTVETHRQHIMQKIGDHNVASLTKYAIREGLTSLET